MEKGLNFRTPEGRREYAEAYKATLSLWDISYIERTVGGTFGDTHCLICGKEDGIPLVLLPAASCGATIWYPNVSALGKHFRIYAIDLITEASMSTLRMPMKGKKQCAQWLAETIDALGIEQPRIAGLSIGGWHAANLAIHHPDRVSRLALLSPIQTLARMHLGFFAKIMKMGFNPTRENVEAYIGWGMTEEGALPDSVIRQFAISAANVNPNAAFPKMIHKKELRAIQCQTLVIVGENEYAYQPKKAIQVANDTILNVKCFY